MKHINSSRRCVSALFILTFLGLTIQNVLALSLVQDGKAQATILVAGDASAQVKKAAQIFQQYIEKSSGVVLPISTSANGNTISIGNTSIVRQSGIMLAELDEDGFILKGIDEKNYVIIGGSDWGTEFGVYDFLERYLSVRWLMPMDLGTDIPQHKTINVPSIEVKEEPVYLSRQLSPMHIELLRNPVEHWARFNRTRGRLAFHHHLNGLFPPSKFMQSNPEFYPLLEGKRYIPASNADYHWQPNFSAPGIVEAAVKQIEQYFETHPDATSYSLGMNDTDNWDQSRASRDRRSGKKNYLGYEDISDDFFLWANEVVKKVLLKYPDKWFGMLAYNGLAEPPTKVKVHPRIVPFICYDRMRWGDEKLRRRGHGITQEWQKSSPVLGWYDYTYGSSYQLPRVYFHREKEYLNWGAKHGVKYIYAELYPNWGEGPKPWISAKLLWNPYQDVDVLLNDWYTSFAGSEAAPKLRNFYAIWEKYWTSDFFKSKWNRDTGQYLPFNFDPAYLLDVPQTYISQSDQAIDAAFELADTPTRKARVAQVKEMWDFYKLSILSYQGNNLPVPISEKEALNLIDEVIDAVEEAQQRQEMLAALSKEDLYSLTAHYISQFPGTNGKNWGISPIWHLVPWVKKSSALKDRLQQLARQNSPVLSFPAAQVLNAGEGKFNLVSLNSSFENGKSSWDIWDKADEEASFHRGVWSITTDQAHSGKQSFLIDGLGRGGPMQNIAYIPGTYLGQVHCYVPQGAHVGIAELNVDVIGKTGGEKISIPTTPISLRPGEWASTTVAFSLPEIDADKTTRIRILLTLNGFEPNGKIYVDDMGIYKLSL